MCEHFGPEKCEWDTLQKLGIQHHCMQGRSTSPTAGKLLSHCKEKIIALRERLGIRVCNFKVGVSASPVSRYDLYRQQGFTHMWILAESSSVDLIHMLEAALISEYHKHVGCQNREGSGGDGALNRVPPPPPPYFAYVVGGRADQGKWFL